MPDIVEYCISNASPEDRQSLPESAEARPCMQECGRCHEGPFLAIEGELVTGDGYMELLAAAEADRR